MADFRTDLYRRYVSAFKGGQAKGGGPSGDASYWAWCRRTYLPLLAGLDASSRILDLGCGAGSMMEFLKRNGFAHVQGIDISAEQIELAKGRGMDAEVADAMSFLEQRESAFDAILALDFVEHFSKDELSRLIRALHRALKPGAVCILQTPNGSGLLPHQIIYGDLTHMTIFTPGSLEQLMRPAGFEQFSFRETGPVAKNAVGAIRVLLWRLVRTTARLVRRIETGRSQQVWTENMICRCVAGRGGESG